MDKLLVLDHELDASNRVVAQAFFCEFNKQLAEERKHHRGGATEAEVSKDVGGMLSYGHQDRAIYRRGAQWQGPSGYETCHMTAREFVVSMSHQGALDRLCEFGADRHSDDDFAVAPTCTQLRR